MKPEIIFAVKVEILRNVLKTHHTVLVLGWPGTGKTATSLRAAQGLWKTYYFGSATAVLPEQEGLCNREAVRLGSINELPVESRKDSLLIIDDYDEASEDVASDVKQLLSGQNQPGKIIITAQARTRLDEGELSVDAVVRMKDETAEIIYTKILDIS
jgi:hypothetical protein